MKAGIGWLLVGLCAIGTYRQIPVWSSDLALWSHAAAVTPDGVRPWVNLSAQLIVSGQFEEARAAMQVARTRVMRPGHERERAVVLEILDRQETWINAFSR